MNMFGYLALAIAALAALAALGFELALLAHRRATPHQGEHVVEVWLEWPLCTGSTLYRQRFRSRWMARLAMRAHALQLDLVLPTHWRTTDWSGRPYMERYDYGIRYGLRQPTPQEREVGVPSIWTCEMPGHKNHAGEHREAHPLLQQELQGKGLEAMGYKI